MNRVVRGVGVVLVTVALLLTGPLLMLATQRIDLESQWHSASRTSIGLAAPALDTPEAVVQVYAARAFNWRGAFGVHTWIAVKQPQATRYRTYQVLSWRRPTVVVRDDMPDRAWFGNAPQMLADYRGETAERMIPRIEAAVAAYPESARYRVWPGPNSNSFVAWVIREVPGLDVALPNTAIGKDYLFDEMLAPVPSGSGYQIGLGGLFGVLLAWEEGVEINLLGLSLGIDLQRPALKLPGIGRLGMAPVVVE
ncbi:DUF3750 domain-containing protein [Litchfieldella xinjiangensis]|uniref:DUF3750 domain-containing protein n=1 Tax=Litchfieldella xinjiangensis TaxID=1166948 RepID=UPI0005B7DEA4|nr:DUF3750 domain-containing protein [Halomonas xinjiangensis]